MEVLLRKEKRMVLVLVSGHAETTGMGFCGVVRYLSNETSLVVFEIHPLLDFWTVLSRDQASSTLSIVNLLSSLICSMEQIAWTSNQQLNNRF